MPNKILLARVLLIASVCVVMHSGDRSSFAQDNVETTEEVNLCRIEMSDKSLVFGVPDLTELKLDLGFDQIVIPFNLISGIQRIKKSPDDGRRKFLVGLQNNDRFTGEVLNQAVKVRFLAGEVTLPFEEIENLRVLGAKLNSSDIASASAVVFLDFEERAEDAVSNLAQRNHRCQLSDVQFNADENPNRGQVASFRGTGNLKIKHHLDLCPPQFTLSAWIQPSGKRREYMFVAGKTSGTWTNGYGFANYNNDRSHLYFFVNGYQGQVIKAAVPSDQWSHLVGTCDGQQIVLYLNGTKVADAPLPDGEVVSQSDTPFMVGADAIGGHWTGQIDDVALHQSAMSADEVKSYFERNR